MPPNGLDAWLEKLTKRSMPVVGKVISDLNKLTGAEDSDLQQLAEVILRDPNMTSHVLRIANSVQYNYTDGPVNTVSRAIVMIGLKGMRAICISLLMIENTLNKAPKERLLALMARGFHGATQARDLVEQYEQESSEEAFVASLLYNIGEMAFLTSEKLDTSNEALFDDDAAVRHKAMSEILGTDFQALSLGLAKHWQLGNTLEEALDPGDMPSKLIEAVLLGEKMSQAAVQGWDSPAVAEAIQDMVVYSSLDPDECLEKAKASAEQAAEVALQYGAASVCPLIPDRLSTVEKKCSADEQRRRKAKVLKSDAQLQLRILRELTASAAEGIDVNTVFQMVLEGIHRGIGLERVTIAMKLHHQVEAKFSLGEGTENWRATFKFDAGPFSENIFTELFEKPGEVWLDEEYLEKHPHLYDQDVKRVIGTVPAFVYILEINGRNVAMFYADRADYGGKLNRDQFDTFAHFAAQAQCNIKMLAQNNKKKR